MRNPFQKPNNTALIATISIGALAAGTIAYLFLTEDGGNKRDDLTRTIKELLKNKAADLVSSKSFVPHKAAKAIADHFVK